MNVSEPLLATEGISRTFRLRGGFFKRAKLLRAVNGVSFAVRQGETVAIVGESGCGKSTLAKMLLGLLSPTSGAIRLDGKPIETLPRGVVARLVQPVFQDPYSSLNPRKTIGSIIMLPLKVHEAGSSAEFRERVIEIMNCVGLPSRFYDRYPNQLSGGQRQRVAIARALVTRPKLVICDEPTSALDVSVQAQILNLLQDLQRDLGLTYIIISHNLAVVEHMASRVCVMYLGRIVEEGPTEQIFEAPRHPYTQALLQSVLTPDPSLGIPEVPLGTAFPNPLNIPPGCSFNPRCPKALPQCSYTPPPVVPFESGFVECHLYP